MGLQQFLLGGGGGGLAESEGAGSGHGLDKEKILSPTDTTAISPTNPGSFASIRSVPVVSAPRYFSPEEATALSQLAKEKSVGAKAAKKAYRKLARIEDCDAQVQKAHRKYEGKVADAELTKKQADARLGRHLHALRPDYARLANGLERAEANADRRISELKSKVMEAWK
ncbi:MAG: hypothetical protein ACM37W_23000 [Actinomycetota bacterium]